jgi:hypothetical protein
VWELTEPVSVAPHIGAALGNELELPGHPLERTGAEPWAIKKDTNIVVHPTYVHNNIMSWVFT